MSVAGLAELRRGGFMNSLMPSTINFAVPYSFLRLGGVTDPGLPDFRNEKGGCTRLPG